MSAGARLRIDYNDLEKPFLLIGRTHDLGGTDYWTICRLTESDARLLAREGITWLYGEPDWKQHWRQLEILKAERDLELARKRVEDLTRIPTGPSEAVGAQARQDYPG